MEYVITTEIVKCFHLSLDSEFGCFMMMLILKRIKHILLLSLLPLCFLFNFFYEELLFINRPFCGAFLKRNLNFSVIFE
jgi:hypothetical protein